MIGGKIKTLKEEIIEILMTTTASSKKIKTILSDGGLTVTVQGIYKQLNTLLLSGVILKNKQNYSISNEWIKDLSEMLSIQDIDLPEEGEKFTYRFNSLQKLDSHWKHIMSSFRKKFKNEAFFSYCPHQIWVYVPTRKKSEIRYKKEHEKQKYYNFYTIGGNTELDKKFKQKFQGDYYRIETLKIAGVKRNTYLSVFGNIIIRTNVNKDLSSNIDAVYQGKKSIKEKEIILINLLTQNSKCTFVIEHNKKKAYKIKRQISQPFYIPEHIRDKIKKQSL